MDAYQFVQTDKSWVDWDGPVLARVKVVGPDAIELRRGDGEGENYLEVSLSEYRNMVTESTARDASSLGNLPKTQAAVMDVYNRALQAGATQAGDGSLMFADEASWMNAAADLGLDVKPAHDPGFLRAMNGGESLGVFNQGKGGFLDFQEVFAALDKAGIVENKEKRMSKRKLKEDDENTVMVTVLGSDGEVVNTMPIHRDSLGLFKDTVRSLGGSVQEGAVTEAVTTPGVVISRNMMVHVFDKGTNRKVDGGLVTKVTHDAVFLCDEEYGKDAYDFMIIG